MWFLEGNPHDKDGYASILWCVDAAVWLLFNRDLYPPACDEDEGRIESNAGHRIPLVSLSNRFKVFKIINLIKLGVCKRYVYIMTYNYSMEWRRFQ